MNEFLAVTTQANELHKTVTRLTNLSVGDFYNVFSRFDWPDALPEDQFWMPPELLTVHGTVERLNRSFLLLSKVAEYVA